MIVREAKAVFRKVGEVNNLSSKDVLDDPAKVHSYVKAFMEAKTDSGDMNPEVEHFFCILLNRKNRPLGIEIVTKGIADSSLVHPREVYRLAIMKGASAIIVSHNHPSGDPAPSSADVRITRQLREASNIIGISLLDHIVVGDKEFDPSNIGYYSFNEAGLI